MKQKTTLASARSSMRWLTTITSVWALLLFLLMGWWGWVVYSQAEKIAELRTQAGLSSSETQADWDKTQRMLIAEASAYFILLAGLSGVMMWLYWRDRQRTRSLHAFLASVTHELKTPLTSIRLQAEALADTSGQSELIDRLLEDTSRLEAQVEKTLELARLEGGGELMLQALPLSAWLEHFHGTLQRPGSIRLELTPSVRATAPLVLADAIALQIVFRNLVENTVRHSHTTPATAQISLEKQQPYLCLLFADNGNGFKGDAKQLGSLFFRGQASQGAGVGLYLIQTLMQRMGGYARFESPPGGGFHTRLYFRSAEDSV